MTTEEAIRLLDQIDGDDPEDAHVTADNILFGLVPEEVCEAYRAVIKRCDWWAYA